MTVPPLARRWLAPSTPDPDAVRRLQAELHLPEPLCRLLAIRGYDVPAAARSFLRPSLSTLHEPDGPDGLADIEPALDRLEHALDHQETILVHGDYDVDGMCAAALFTRALRAMGGNVVPFVPHRMRDGYDLGPGGVRRAAEADASLILTADCGILAHDAVEAARQLGIDVIVTDHHTPGDTLPGAVAVINPRRADCGYPHDGLSGTGVAFKVAWALARRRGVDLDTVRYLLDLVALATVADVMPLTDENRVLTRFGLRLLAETRNPGLEALVRSSGLSGKTLGAGHLSHGLAPRLNAVGRLGDAERGLRLLLAERAEAESLAAELEEVNVRRKSVDRTILAQALDELAGYDASRDRGVVLARRGWHAGVIGIVASRVVERIHRPAVLITVPEDGGLGRGSARSIPGFDLLDAIRACGEHLERFGGHRAAAGFDIRPDRIDAFRDAFARAARERLPEPPLPELRIDVPLSVSDVTPELVRYLAYAGPFGVGNPTPVFLLRGVRVEAPKTVGRDGQHVKARLREGDVTLDAIGFRMAESHGALLRSGEPVDVAARLEENHWNGRSRPQAKLVDARPAD